ncbi:MAG TPA: RraA family protein [Terricaulis sp.]|nr:RraA family protein [Terricaulis sp.]
MTEQNDQWRGYVRRLRRLDACAVSDALDSLGKSGAVSGLPRRSGGGVIAGRALTVKVGPGSARRGPARHLGVAAIEKAGVDDVIVVEQRSEVEAGCWGGLLTLAAKLRGVAGVVADGPLRDVDEAIAYGFPVFSRSLTTRTARGRVVELEVGDQVHVGDIWVAEGDFVIADGSGVVFVPAEDAEAVIAAAETIAHREAAMAKALLSGTSPSEVMGGQYEHMLERKP